MSAEEPGKAAPEAVVGHLVTTRTARYCLWGDPAAAWREAWFVLHGYAQLAAEIGRAALPLLDADRLVVAPEGLSRFYRAGGSGAVGASWMTREEREEEIADTLVWLDRLRAHLQAGRAPASAAAVHSVLGFSQGAAAAARWSVLGSLPPRRLVLWGGGLPPDLPPEAARSRLEAVEVVLVAGTEDPYVDAARLEEEAERLRAVAPHARVERFEGGHRLDRALLASLA